ncbi:MAG TPA: sarcosine oxidase subunit beta family protein [Xanthomonadales bacterium]|nr:sarcosine oxidase subunit beta family protein [Xanthomonadales bacterium]
MRRYSAFSLAAHALLGHKHWPAAWQKAQPRDSYDVLVIGAGGHGLATAYYLASKHKVGRIGVVDKGYLGGGNSGRNTQVCRSNYFYPQSGAFYEHSLQLYEQLGHKLNFNIMFSQRGVLELSHSVEELDMNRRWANAMQMHGIDSEILDREALQREVPGMNLQCRFPIRGGFIQRRGGISRHDAVVWAYARAASRHGVEIIENCEVTGFERDQHGIAAVHTTRGRIAAGTVVSCVAGHSSQLAAMVGLRLPIQSMALQAMVTEPVKPVLDTVVASAAVHVYLSQSDRGEIVIGGGADVYSSFAQRGSLSTTIENAAATVELFPMLSRLRVMRQWAGVCDIAPDASPIVGHTEVPNFYISTGWGTGGFKAIPAGGDTLAWSIARGEMHPLLKPYSLQRFSSGHLIDEAAAAGVAH